MKKHVILIVLGLLFLNGTALSLLADIIPAGSHFVNREVTITNSKDFQEVVLIGYITGPMIDGYEAQVVKDNIPLYKGYKMNTYTVFAIKKTVLEQAGGIESIDFRQIADTVSPVEILDPGDQYVSDENPLSEEFYYYAVVKTTDDILTLKLTRQVLKYLDGRADKTIDY